MRDSLHCEPERTAPLAQLVHEKTTGNPFFAIQFISALADEGLLTFDHGEARWSWDLNRIHAKGYTDNVVDLMVGKLNRLPVETQKALQQLACLGNSAEFTLLPMVYEDLEGGDARQALGSGASRARLSFGRCLQVSPRPCPGSRLFFDPGGIARRNPSSNRAAVRGADPSREAGGDDLRDRQSAQPRLTFITSPEERERVAELNLIAGRRAKASTAYASALKYLVAGAALLAEDCWEHRHELIFALELHRAECEFLTGAMAAAEERLTMLSARAQTRSN